jgi:phosphohistidine phosphatase
MRLLLMRHAEAASAPGLPDHDRPLTPHGEQDARAIGRWLRDHGGEPPQLALCSTALRAARTCELVTGQLEPSPEVRHLKLVYQAGADDLRTLVETCADEVSTVLVVGHNPAVSQLGRALTDHELPGFPAGALAALDVDGTWGRPTAVRVAAFTTPDTLARR